MICSTADVRNTGLLSFGDSEEIPADISVKKKGISRTDCEYPAGAELTRSGGRCTCTCSSSSVRRATTFFEEHCGGFEAKKGERQSRGQR